MARKEKLLPLSIFDMFAPFPPGHGSEPDLNRGLKFSHIAAISHDSKAIQTHWANHTDIIPVITQKVDHLDMLITSPVCTNFSSKNKKPAPLITPSFVKKYVPPTGANIEYPKPTILWATIECKVPLSSARGGLIHKDEFNKTIIGTHYMSMGDIMRQSWEHIKSILDEPPITITENI